MWQVCEGLVGPHSIFLCFGLLLKRLAVPRLMARSWQQSVYQHLCSCWQIGQLRVVAAPLLHHALALSRCWCLQLSCFSAAPCFSQLWTTRAVQFPLPCCSALSCAQRANLKLTMVWTLQLTTRVLFKTFRSIFSGYIQTRLGVSSCTCLSFGTYGADPFTSPAILVIVLGIGLRSSWRHRALK